MKLYEIPRESRIVGLDAEDGSTYITFHHLDGMYSYCTTEKGGVCHLSASMPLKMVSEGVYELDSQN